MTATISYPADVLDFLAAAETRLDPNHRANLVYRVATLRAYRDPQPQHRSITFATVYHRWNKRYKARGKVIA